MESISHLSVPSSSEIMLIWANAFANVENRYSEGSTIFALNGENGMSVFLITEYAEGVMKSIFWSVKPESWYPSARSNTIGRMTLPLRMMARWNRSSEATFSGRSEEHTSELQ